MAKYIIDVPDDTTCINALKYKDSKCVAARSYIFPDLTPYVKSESYIDGLKKGQNDAWEFARRIICPSECCEDSISAHTKEIFNKEGWEIRGIFNDLSYQDAKSKYDAWEKRKDEIRVGDEVVDTETDKGIVTYIRGYLCDVLWDDGGVTEEVEREELYKTGRHFNEVEELLKKMREE